MRLATRAITLTLSSTLLVTALASTAVGRGNGNGPSRGGTDGNYQDGKLSASTSHTQIVISSTNNGDGGGNLTPQNADWTPPVCWYEPYMTPKEFEAEVDALEERGGMGRLSTHGAGSVGVFHDIYRDNDPGPWVAGELGAYENYNLNRQGEGMWWVGVVNENRKEDFEGGIDCRLPIFWADFTEAPDVPESITPEMLAEYAYDEIGVPETEIELNPAAHQKVKLATWIWLDETVFDDVTVRAELPGTGLWAETTASPRSLRIDPGTTEAQLHPGSGECEIRDGRIGEPYTRGRTADTPPCGVTYQRATHTTGPYELTATLTWDVSWEGSGGAGGTLPEGVFETTHDIVVEEIQAIIRR